MSLDKNDLQQIKIIVQDSAETTKNELRKEIKQEIGGVKQELMQEIGGVKQELMQEIGGVKQELMQEIGGVKQVFKQEIGGVKKMIFDVEEKLTSKMEANKNEIISIISKEVTDLADINRAVITRTDELDYRLRIVERKLGLTVR
ncbi:MAG: hypothetical protein WCW17_04160 [Patescibacteria group bacterium]